MGGRDLEDFILYTLLLLTLIVQFFAFPDVYPKLEEPALDLAENVAEYVGEVLRKLVSEVFKKYPLLLDTVQYAVRCLTVILPSVCPCSWPAYTLHNWCTMHMQSLWCFVPTDEHLLGPARFHAHDSVVFGWK